MCIFHAEENRNMYKLLFLTLMLVMMSCETQSPSKNSETSDFNEALATQLGADDYGMAPYVVAFLKSGPNRPTDPKEAEELQAAHMQNINRMAEEGKLVLAGPFLGAGDLKGIYVFDVKTIEEAKALTESDPAIQTGSLVMELHQWYGSAAVRQISEIHDKISKIKM